MPHRRSRASHEAHAVGVVVHTAAQGEPACTTSDPTAVLFALEALHSASRTLSISYLRIAARRLRQAFADIERIIETVETQQ